MPNHKFLEILSSKASKLAKSSDPEPQIGLKFSSHGYILLRNSVHYDPKFGSGRSQAPLSGPHSGRRAYKWKLSAPPPVLTV